MGYMSLREPSYVKQCKQIQFDLYDKKIPINEIADIIQRYVKYCSVGHTNIKNNDTIKVLYVTSSLLNKMKDVLANLTLAVNQLEEICIANPSILMAIAEDINKSNNTI